MIVVGVVEVVGDWILSPVFYLNYDVVVELETK